MSVKEVGILPLKEQTVNILGAICMLLSGRSQYEKTTYGKIPTRWHSGKGKTLELVRSVIFRGRLRGVKDE